MVIGWWFAARWRLECEAWLNEREGMLGDPVLGLLGEAGGERVKGRDVWMLWLIERGTLKLYIYSIFPSSCNAKVYFKKTDVNVRTNQRHA